MDSGALFSPCRQYRYKLWRIWDASKPALNVIGLNPSTADELKDDPTIRRCISFARDWNHGGLVMTNLFAFRATKPTVMKAQTEPVGAENDRWLKEVAAEAGLVIAAWGNHGAFLNRSEHVRAMMPVKLYCFRLTSKEMPEHPLYMPKNIQPVLF